MRTTILTTLLLSFGCGNGDLGTFTTGGDPVQAQVGDTHEFDFAGPAGAVPTGFVSVLGEWTTIGDAVAQVAEHAGPEFPRMILKNLVFADLDLAVRCRPESGEIDQACGLMFRLQDSNNYLVVRANALEDNVRLYEVVDGDRRQLASADTTIAANVWHDLGITVRGDDVQVSWDGRQVLGMSVSTLAPGKVGLWVKADSSTTFDDLSVTGR